MVARSDSLCRRSDWVSAVVVGELGGFIMKNKRLELDEELVELRREWRFLGGFDLEGDDESDEKRIYGVSRLEILERVKEIRKLKEFCY
jgi:hypothetical protein